MTRPLRTFVRFAPVCVVLMALAAPRAAAQYEEVWLTKLGGPGNNGLWTYSSELAPDGRLWVAAHLMREEPDVQWGGYGIHNLLLLRFDSAGRLEWMRDLPDTLGSLPVEAALRVDSEGCAYVATWLNGETALTKYSPRGVELWRRALDLDWDGSGTIPMAIDAEGRVLVAGNTRGWDPQNDLQVAQYDADGHLRWQATCSGPEPGYLASRQVATDALGRVHLTASSSVHGATSFWHEVAKLSIAFDGDGKLLWRSEYDCGPGERLQQHLTEVRQDGTRTTALSVLDASVSTYSQKSFVLDRIGPSGERQWTVTEPVPPLRARQCNGLRTAPWGDLIVSGSCTKYNPFTLEAHPKALVEAYSESGQKRWSGRTSMTCSNSSFDGQPIFDAHGRLLLVTHAWNGPACSNIDVVLEPFSAGGLALPTTRIQVPRIGSMHSITGLLDASGDLRLVGTASWIPDEQKDYGEVLFAGRYTSR